MTAPKRVSTICALSKTTDRPESPWLLAPARNLAWLASSQPQEQSRWWRDRPCRFAPATGIVCQNGPDFPPNCSVSASCVVVEATQHRDPLADVLNSGGSLGHPACSEKPGFHGDVRWKLPVRCDHVLEQDECPSS